VTPVPPGPAASARSATLERRRAIGAEVTAEWGARACARFIRSFSSEGLSWTGKKVALYRSLPGEPDLSALVSFFLAQGAELAYPRVIDLKSGDMAMVRVQDPAVETWQPGPYGIDEPASHGAIVPPEDLDLIVVPGAAFGVSGERIGMGAGFYDRYLVRAKRAQRVAIAFEYQVYPVLTQSEWDQPVTWLFTEEREIHNQ